MNLERPQVLSRQANNSQLPRKIERSLNCRSPTIDTNAQREKVQNDYDAKKETGLVKERVAIPSTLTFSPRLLENKAVTTCSQLFCTFSR